MTHSNFVFLESGTRPLSRPRAGCRRWLRAPSRWWSLWWRARGWGPGARTDGAGPQTDWDRQRAGRETSMITWDVMTSQETLKHNLWWNSATLKWAPKGNKSSIHYIEIILSHNPHVGDHAFKLSFSSSSFFLQTRVLWWLCHLRPKLSTFVFQQKLEVVIARENKRWRSDWKIYRTIYRGQRPVGIKC